MAFYGCQSRQTSVMTSNMPVEDQQAVKVSMDIVKARDIAFVQGWL